MDGESKFKNFIAFCMQILDYSVLAMVQINSDFLIFFSPRHAGGLFQLHSTGEFVRARTAISLKSERLITNSISLLSL